ncbi:hypothetical protein E5288_WYG010162 [Bos mutus]|uniref:ADP-ribosylation factor-like protein 2-binding protein n=1 Tax=Bos mutus TaxID=72004 RepID=A0A6B0R833_9CETA|nr:hypothetical protein [Bos mutus]
MGHRVPGYAAPTQTRLGPRLVKGHGMDIAEVTEVLEEESLAVSTSSTAEAEFDAVVGSREDMIMDAEFQVLKRNFMDRYYQEFKNTEENKLTYPAIFNKNLSSIEKYIENQLLERIPGYNMAIFTRTLKHHNDEMVHDVFNMLTCTDFPAFKEMFLEYRTEKEGRRLDLCSGLVVTSLCKSASQNNTKHHLLRPGSGSLLIP